MGLPAAESCRWVLGLLFSRRVLAEAPGESSTLVSNEELFFVLVGGLMAISSFKVELSGEPVFPKPVITKEPQRNELPLGARPASSPLT